MNDAALSRGFAVMSTALNNAGHNCNIVTQAESMVMAKERLVEQYGEIRYTIGTGCSGGSLTQQQVANAYPGIYQGILPACSFPDSWSTGQQLVDYHLVRRYAENPAKWGTGRRLGPGARSPPSRVTPTTSTRSSSTPSTGPRSAIPDDGCPGVPAEDNYNAADQPRRRALHARGLHDQRASARGRRACGSPAEQQVGHGFAGLPLDNVGVQYGLEALKKGTITTEQFVDLNDKIGGGDIDINPTAERFQADQPALANAYRSGGVNSANNLDKVAIIDLRGPDPGAFHDAYRSWAIRARLEREHGTFANQVIWFGAVPLMGDPNYATEGMLAMDRWLAAVEADNGTGTLAEKIIRDRPGDVNDRCSQVDGRRAGLAARRRDGLRAEGGPDPVRDAPHGRRRGRRDRQEQVHAQAAAAARLLPDHVHGRPVAATPAGVPGRRLRLERARGRPGRTRSRGRPYQDDGRQRRLRRPVARRGTERPRAAAGPATRSGPGAIRRSD